MKANDKVLDSISGLKKNNVAIKMLPTIFNAPVTFSTEEPGSTSGTTKGGNEELIVKIIYKDK